MLLRPRENRAVVQSKRLVLYRCATGGLGTCEFFGPLFIPGDNHGGGCDTISSAALLVSFTQGRPEYQIAVENAMFAGIVDQGKCGITWLPRYPSALLTINV